jgi:hypothetical protein
VVVSVNGFGDLLARLGAWEGAATSRSRGEWHGECRDVLRLPAFGLDSSLAELFSLPG